jgi:hypothetical protein
LLFSSGLLPASAAVFLGGDLLSSVQAGLPIACDMPSENGRD